MIIHAYRVACEKCDVDELLDLLIKTCKELGTLDEAGFTYYANDVARWALNHSLITFGEWVDIDQHLRKVHEHQIFSQKCGDSLRKEG